MNSNLTDEISGGAVPEYSVQLDKAESKEKTKFRKGRWALAFRIDPRPRKSWYDKLKIFTEKHQLKYNWERGENHKNRGYIIFYTDYAGSRDKMVEKLRDFKEKCEEILSRATEAFRSEKIEELQKEKSRKQIEREQREMFSEILEEIEDQNSI